jgi:twinkle protein
VEYTFEHLPWRGISRDTMSFYNVLTMISPEGKPMEIGYPYGGATKIRKLEKKEFYAKGEFNGPGLFGKDRWPAGCAKTITIVEGEGDVLAFTEMFGKAAPVVSVKNGASGAKKDCSFEREYLNSFSEIVLCFDADDQGQKAATAVAPLFDFNKVRHVKLEGCKDPLEFLETDRRDQFKKVWWNAKRYMPANVKSSFAEFDQIIDDAANVRGVPWPFEKLSYLTGGIKMGRSYLVSGLEGIGKTEFFHATETHLLRETDDNIAIIHIEEPIDENLKRKAGYVLKQAAHFDDSPVSKDDVKKAYRDLFKRDDRVHIYNHYGSDDPDAIVDLVRFLVAAVGCRYVFLDNITFIVTGRTGEDERRELDYLSSKLEMLVKELNFALIMISHENDHEQTRGSRNISKVADVWINLKRDIKNHSEFIRSIIEMSLFKGRGCRGTGPAGRLILDPDSHTLKEIVDEIPAD